MNQSTSDIYVPALGFKALTPVFQFVVDVFCRDTYIKGLILQQVQGENLKLLDVACGTGKFVKLLAEKQRCCHIVAMDIDPDMISDAELITKNYPNVSVVQGDVTEMKFEDKQFNIVFECLMFHHLTDEQNKKAIEEIHRVLKNDGVFFFVDWIKPTNLFSKAAFQIVKWFDGSENVIAHETNSVLLMIKELFELETTVQVVETSLGSIGVIKFVKQKY